MNDILDFIDELNELKELYNTGDLRNFDLKSFTTPAICETLILKLRSKSISVW